MAGFNRLMFLVLAAFTTLPSWAAEMPLAECREKADAGDAEAQYQLGKRYEEGAGVGKNGIRAVIQYKKAAEQKHRKACARLSELYSRGEFVKKDAVLAAKYGAMAGGENEAIAVARAKEKGNAEKMDEIEDALDWILGRNGKSKDPKIGIRMLYEAAKKKPAAKMVFVKRWQQGDLDAALSVLTEDEWELVVPWFREAFGAGLKTAGLVIGNNERYRKNYLGAADYYMAAGKAGISKAWYFYGLLYWTESDEKEWGMPKYMKSDRKARTAFEHALKQNPSCDDVRWKLGLLCLYSKDETCADSKKAFDIFSRFYAKDKADKYNVWLYGFSGYAVAYDQIERNLELYKRAFNTRPGAIDYAHQTKQMREYEELVKQKAHYVQYIRQAAQMGCEPAQKFMENYKPPSN